MNRLTRFFFLFLSSVAYSMIRRLLHSFLFLSLQVVSFSFSPFSSIFLLYQYSHWVSIYSFSSIHPQLLTILCINHISIFYRQHIISLSTLPWVNWLIHPTIKHPLWIMANYKLSIVFLFNRSPKWNDRIRNCNFNFLVAFFRLCCW